MSERGRSGDWDSKAGVTLRRMRHGDTRGQAPANRGLSWHRPVFELGSTGPYFDDIDERWAEERTYDEAYGPPDPHRGPPSVDEWSSGVMIDAMEIMVAVEQQAAYNVATFSPLGRVLHWGNASRFAYNRGCRCDECCAAAGIVGEPKSWNKPGRCTTKETVLDLSDEELNARWDAGRPAQLRRAVRQVHTPTSRRLAAEVAEAYGIESEPVEAPAPPKKYGWDTVADAAILRYLEDHAGV